MDGDYLINQLIRAASIEIGDKLNQVIARVRNDVLGDIQYLVRNEIKASPEYTQLTGGFFSGIYHEFGIPDIKERMDRIIEQIVKDIKFDVIIAESNLGDSLEFHIQISILSMDYGQLLSMPEASFVTRNGYTLDWLRWLLIDGYQPVVLGYHYVPKISRSSRTGFGLMVPRREWFVPDSLVGNYGDNWLTRSIKPIEERLPTIIENIFRYF